MSDTLNERHPYEISGDPDYMRQDAINTLWNMSIIAEADMMERGIYVDSDVTDTDRAERGAICGGRRACAVGSLWLGARVPMKYYNDVTCEPVENVAKFVEDNGWRSLSATMPKTASFERETMFEERPYLGLAYRALNVASMKHFAVRYPDRFCQIVESLSNPVQGPNVGWAEQLFEDQSAIPDEQLGQAFRDICDRAIEIIRWDQVS